MKGKDILTGNRFLPRTRFLQVPSHGTATHGQESSDRPRILVPSKWTVPVLLSGQNCWAHVEEPKAQDRIGKDRVVIHHLGLEVRLRLDRKARR